MSHSSDNLSSAVQRVIAAAQAAAAAGEREVLPADLLVALSHEEGHAAELLRGAGFAPEAVLSAPEGAEQFSLGRLLRSARRLTRSGDETSSVHLLAALAQTEDAIAGRLADHGLTPEVVLESIGPAEPSATPIEVDVRIAPAAPAVDDLSSVLRILDAAANRAREGLRVLEDQARFSLGDQHLTSRIKEFRHRLATLAATLLGDRALRLRNTVGDVGVSVHTRLESRRESDDDITRANAARVQEALRSLEEYGKRLDPRTAMRLGELRYETYTLEQALITNHQARHRLADMRVCLLATDALCPRGIGPVVTAALAGGCRMVQLREKNVPDNQLIARARLLREWTRAADALLIINDRPDIAVLVDADGVHVGQQDLSIADARRIVGGSRLVGASTHHVEQLRRAVLDGADYLGVGPVYPSRTKSFESLAGLEFVRAAAKETTLPWFAIGGITRENVAEVLAAGAQRVAVSGDICGADDPETAMREFTSQLVASP